MAKINIKNILPNVLTDESLARYTTFKIGGNAKYFLVVKNKEELVEAISAAKSLKLKIFILAGGSNILFADKGFNGLVIKNEIGGLECKENRIFVGSGVTLANLVKKAVSCGLSGVEWAAGIPGTVGGSIYGNAQAFSERMADIVEEVEAVDLKTLKIKIFKNSDCKFTTKNSVFKKKNNLVIVSAILSLKKGDEKEMREKLKEHISYRRKNHPLSFPCAGSVFVNPETKIKSKKLLKEFPELEEFNKKGFVHSGFLIDKCELRGKKFGDAQISEKHANFIINIGNAKANDIIKLISLVKAKVKKKFGIKLQEEIIIVK